MKTNNPAWVAAATLIVGIALTGCADTSGASSTPTASVALVPVEAEPGDWWDSPEHAASADGPEDTLTVHFVMVDDDDQDNTLEYTKIEGNLADDPESPASITPSGNIRIGVLLESKSLYREIVESYVSTDREGKKASPPMSCNTYPLTETRSQGFRCRTEFQDKEYSDGVYYAVVVTNPAGEQNNDYGQKALIIPIYTRLPDSPSDD